MQRRPSQRNTQADALFERVTSNRSILEVTGIRMEMVRGEVQKARDDYQRRRLEARVGLDELADSLAAVRRSRPKSDRRPSPRVHSRCHPVDDVEGTRQQLHEAYARTRDPLLRDDLMSSYDGFARSLALTFRNRESVDDLVQVARIGLLHAIDRFDPTLGRPFALFARVTITGELKRHLRDRTWAMRVPRSLQEDYLAVMRAVDDLTAERSGSPSIEALATRCGMPMERVLEALELRFGQRTLSIDPPAGTGPDEPVVELGEEDIRFEMLENRDFLTHLLARLPERDRRILELRFIQEKTQSEIAAEVGVSQMCVSRVLARTLGRLRLWARTAVA